ncbi:MAG: peroxiredoxin family protein [Oceanihabitans sp.]
MKKHFLILVTFLTILSCKNENPKTLELASYRAELQVSETETLPFLFKVISKSALEIYNAKEVITVNEIKYENDSVYINMPVFEGYLVAKIENNTLNGSFVKPNLNRVVPLKAFKSDTRFESNTKPLVNITGNWETVFSPNTEADKYLAKGIFTQEGNKVTGTFRTTTGDYRYLEGVINGNQLELSTFDGAHAFLFKAKVTDSTMQGKFYSGNHWEEPFVAKRNESFTLPDANNLTFLNEGYNKLAFSFPDATGKMVSLTDKRFQNKVVLVQIMGTWCPNCLDESIYYSEFYNENNKKDFEIVALAFEYVKTEKKAFNNIKRLQDRVGIKYPILLAQTGTSSKSAAQEKLPMLNHVLSYPTTIFIDKEGKVRKIHTGFNGPATGEKFTDFKLEFTGFIEALLKE